jgi:hypothetical protein
VPTAVLRAGVIIGSGSASFEMLRYLTERLPVMITPKWVRSRTQPIAIQDVLHTLAGCVRLPQEVNRAFDIGGPDVLTYAQMIKGTPQWLACGHGCCCRWACSARRCPAIGSGWSPRYRVHWPARWWNPCATTRSRPSKTSPDTCPTHPAG